MPNLEKAPLSSHIPEIAIASGKGGTGKTTVAVNLAACLTEPIVLADCDVEEPNAHIFLNPLWTERRESTVLIPVFDAGKCDRTGACREVCRYNALIILGQKPLLFPDLCHSCGGCVRACPNGAVSEITRPIGQVEKGHQGSIHFIQGTLNVGEGRSTPLIKDVREIARKLPGQYIIIDAPPGTSCPVIEAIKDVDYVVLVTEPTPFGLSDLKLAVGMVRKLGIRHGIIINRADIGDRKVLLYCQQEKIPVLAEIPADRKAAELYAAGSLLVDHDEKYRLLFTDLFASIAEELKR